MLKQVADLLEEGSELNLMLSELGPNQWQDTTPFKSWTVNQVVQHLHGSDIMAVMALKDEKNFRQMQSNMAQVTKLMHPDIEGLDLHQRWWEYFCEMCDLLAELDPKKRVPWFGPDMGVMMFSTARQMEAWSHGQDIFDMFGRNRINKERLKNIVVIGVKTYGWTFINRGLPVPEPAPYIELIGPNAELWEFNERDDQNYVKGDAAEFCHVVTQGRNIEDVELEVLGGPATEWMKIAQCFAGPPEDPPLPGSRMKNFSK